jgi:hypothetical protein
MKAWISNKKFRISLYIAAGFFFLLILLYWWFRLHVKDIIEQLVAYESKGKVTVKIGGMNIRFFHPPRIDLINTRLMVLDKTGKKVVTTVSFKYLGLELKSLRSLVLEKKLLVDYIVAEDPAIEVSPENKNKAKKGNESVPFEIGNIYLALEKITQTLEVKKFRIFNGSLGLKNLPPNNKTITIGGVEFNVEDFALNPTYNKKSDGNLFIRNLELKTGKQDITFPEGNYRLKYSSLEISSKENTITLDSLFIEGKSNDTTYGALEAGFSRLKLINTDFKAIYESNKIKVDSIFCMDPVVRLKIDITKKEKEKVDEERSIEKNIAGLIGHLDIGYLGLLNSDITLTTKNKDKYMPFSTRGNNFEASGIVIDSAKANPIEIGKLVFAIKNYKTSSADSMYDVRFDSVVYDEHTLILKNFRLEPSEKNYQKDKKYVSIPDFELREISLAELISNQRLKAEELVLKNSRTINYYYPKSDQIKPTQPITKIIDEIDKKIDLVKVRIENGYLLSQSVSDKTQKIEVTGINSNISTNELLRAPTYEIMGYSIGRLVFEKASITTGKTVSVFDKGQLYGKEKLILAGAVSITNLKNKSTIKIKDIRLSNYHFDDALSEIFIDSISWKNADIIYRKDSYETKGYVEKAITKKKLNIGHFTVQNTTVNFYSGDTAKGMAEIKAIDLNGISADTDGNMQLEDFMAEGNKIELDLPSLKLSTGSFSFRENRTSFLNEVNLDYQTVKDTAKLRISRISLVPLINKSLNKKYPAFQEIELQDPVIYTSFRPGEKLEVPSDEKEEKNFMFETGLFQLSNGKVNFNLWNGAKSIQYKTEYLDSKIKDIYVGKEDMRFSMGAFNIISRKFDLKINDSIDLYAEPGKFEMVGSGLKIGQGANAGLFNAGIELIRIDSLNTSVINKKDGTIFELKNISLGGNDFIFDSSDRRHIIRQIRYNPSLFVKDINLARKNDLYEMAAFGIGFENKGRQLSLDSFYYHPVMDRDSFNRMHAFQKDYIQAKTGRIIIRELDIEKLLADTSFRASAIEIKNPDISIYKDKRLPFDFSEIKPLPVDMLKNLKIKVELDSILVRNGYIQYSEHNPKTDKIAIIDLPHTQAELTNIKNYNISSTDSLRLRATTRLLDSVRISVHHRESYTDTLSGFLYSVRVSPFDLKLLNQFLPEIASAKILSGKLDTIRLRAIGREYLALGYIDMHYRDLKIQYLDKGDIKKKTFVTKIVTFLANTLIDKSNTKKIGRVYTERVREKAVINYWIKILLSGALTSAGIKDNKKQLKKYHRKRDKLHVPEIPDVAF